MNARLLECPIALIQAPHPEKAALPNVLLGAMKINIIPCDRECLGIPSAWTAHFLHKPMVMRLAGSAFFSRFPPFSAPDCLKKPIKPHKFDPRKLISAHNKTNPGWGLLFHTLGSPKIEGPDLQRLCILCGQLYPSLLLLCECCVTRLKV